MVPFLGQILRLAFSAKLSIEKPSSFANIFVVCRSTSGTMKQSNKNLTLGNNQVTLEINIGKGRTVLVSSQND